MLIDANARFDPDALPSPVLGIASRLGQHDSGLHKHGMFQLLHAMQGCMSIQLDGMKCVLPPNRAAWIPAHMLHCATMRNVVEYRSLYFDAQWVQCLPRELAVIEVTPLLRELIERMSFWEWDKPLDSMKNTLALFFEELAEAKTQSLFLPLPQDKRLSRWLEHLERKEDIVPPLKVLSQQIGASGKTISRILQKETGMSYQAWRQQWRLLKAIEWLSEGKAVNDVAYGLAFSSDSAFISFFKQQVGETPLRFQKINDCRFLSSAQKIE